jgi:hypothetical protein
MDPHKVAEFISLSLTSPSLVFSLLIIWHFLPAALVELRSRRQLDYKGWMILGVAVSFIGKFLDNLYWAIPWSSSYIGSENTIVLFNAGVFFNIPDRQLATVIAGACHLKSIYLLRKQVGKPTPPLWMAVQASIILAMIHLFVLEYLKRN